jgi:AraC-like DNA-binding protein
MGLNDRRDSFTNRERSFRLAAGMQGNALIRVDTEVFRRAPLGRYLVGHSFVLWMWDEKLAGSMYFGRPDERDFPLLLEFGDMPLHPALDPPWNALIDCGAMDHIDAAAFEILARHIGESPPIAARVDRVALVRPPGLPGATVAGIFYEMIRPHFRAGLFTDRAEAFDWLGHPAGSDARAEIERIAGEVQATPALLRALRHALASEPRGLSIERASKMLATSPRSLQRRIGELGTSLRAEVERARVRSAEALLIESDLKLGAIAARLGFASPSHFSLIFRRVTGESPGEFRRRRHPATPERLAQD